MFNARAGREGGREGEKLQTIVKKKVSCREGEEDCIGVG